MGGEYGYKIVNGETPYFRVFMLILDDVDDYLLSERYLYLTLTYFYLISAITKMASDM